MSNEGTPLSELLNEPSEELITEEIMEGPTEGLTGDGEPPRLSDDRQPRGPDGKFISTKADDTGVTQPAPPADRLPQEEYGALRAIRDENKGLKAELEALRNQFQQSQQPKEPLAPPPSLWEDEQGWQQHFGSQIAQHAAFNARLDISEMMARDKHEDFDAMKASFLEMAQQNPAVVQQALGDPHPWAKAYQIAKNAATMAELGATDLETLRAKLREEIMAEQQAQPPVSQVQLPPTLTAERNVGTRSGPAWSGPKPLNELLG